MRHLDSGKRFLILFAFGLSGAAALIYEVTWTRAISVILGSTTYALSTMLSTFMAGLALGAFIGGRIADRRKNLLLIFGLAELGIGAFGLITVPLINALPPLYFAMYKEFYASPLLYFLFQFFLCAGIMLVPTTLMGVTFPVVSRELTSQMEEMGRGVGNAYSFNTAGAILGSFSAGFVLIPLVGVKMATILAAAMNLIVAVSMFLLSKTRIRGAHVLGMFLAVSFPFAAALLSEEDAWPVGLYQAQRIGDYAEYRKSLSESVLLSDKQYREGRVRAWRDKYGFLILQVGGKIEGTGASDMTNAIMLGYLPLAAHPSPRSFLNIGLGAGITLQVVREHIKDVSLVEINEGVIVVLAQLGPPGLLDGVDTTIHDARYYLMTTDRKFDIISSEPSYPTEYSVGNLFTREFFELAAARLNPGGIYCQWLPFYQVSKDDVLMMLRTFRSVFRYVSLWQMTESLDLVMVGTDTPFQFDTEEIIQRISSLNKQGLPLRYRLSKSPLEVDAILESGRDIPLNTDDRPLLEFNAARNLITGVKD